MPPKNQNFPLEDDPLWYKDAIIYELHVRAFYDSGSDGMGDFRGLTEKLDYLQDLGVTAIWLLPFCPSPWRDDGYDISGYTDVHPSYGTLRDFRAFLAEAHRRGLRVITELVLNHTSDQHSWFQRSRRATPGSRWRDFYVWSNTPDKYKEARIIFKDFESSNWNWDPVANAYYWHRFYSHQPDLNYDSPSVRRAILEVIDFWLDLGVDGYRLDAVPYLFEREGTNCENLPETHAFLKELRRHVDTKYRNRVLLAEANQWPEDAIAYLGDECEMAFHFPLMPRLFMSIRMEDRFPIIDILQQTPPIPESSQWALFLRNHDELTLEMVTDEERDYMYRVYAQDAHARINLGIRRRLAPLLNNDRKKIELMNALLFSLPGTPVIYYGDEIGMGDNFYLGDRNGVRTPMQWSPDRNAGFSRANPQQLYLPVIIDPEYHHQALNVEAQQNNPHSLLWWTKRLIALRKQFRSLSRGGLEFLHPENRRVLAFYRQHQAETILVVANLSRFVQAAELDLSSFKGMTPVEMFGSAEFPTVGEQPYFLTLGPHGFYWFSLESRQTPLESVPAEGAVGPSVVVTVPSEEELFHGKVRTTLEKLLPRFLPTRRWFLAKARRIRSAEICEVIPVPQTSSYLLLARLDYVEGDPDIYLLAAATASGQEAEQVLSQISDVVVVRFRKENGQEGILYSALWDKSFPRALLETIAQRRRLKGEAGELVVSRTHAYRGIWASNQLNFEGTVLKSEQHNNSIAYGDQFILKLLRRVEPGIHPEVELGVYLTEHTSFPHIAPLAAWLEYRPASGQPMTLAVVHGFIPSEGDAWQHTLHSLSLFFERALARRDDPVATTHTHPLDLAEKDIAPPAEELIGTYLERARLMGQRTAELQLVLAQDRQDPAFAPETATDAHRQGMYHSMLGRTTRYFQLLRQHLSKLPKETQPEAKQVLDLEGEIRRRLAPIRSKRISTVRIRHHGQYELKELLYTGKDFVIIDFEGEPERPLNERRYKRSALMDVAGLLRSFHYASHAALFGQVAGIISSPEKAPALEAWAEFWTSWVSASFLKGYLAAMGKSQLLPSSKEEIRLLLDVFLLDRVVYEMGQELIGRSDWVRIPLHGILQLMATSD